jgi:branched-chain amino acid transport system substrate-binding protein
VKTIRTFALLVAALVLVAVLPARGAGAPVEVPVVLSLTGQNALLGATLRKALEVYEKSANESGGISGAPVHFTYLDDGTNPQTAVQLVNQVIASKAPVMIGPGIVATCRAAAPLVEKNGPVQYCLSPGGPTPKGGFSFASGYATPDAFKLAVRYFHDRGLKRIGILAPTDATGQDGEHSLDAALAEYKDMTVVAREHYNVADLSVSAQIVRIKAADPQMLFAWATGTPIGTVLHGMIDVGLDIPTFTSHGNMTYTAMGQLGDLAPKAGLYFAGPLFISRDLLKPGPARDGVDRFTKSLQAAGVNPDAGYSLAWDAALVVVDALRHVGANPSAEQIRDYIEQLHGLPGATAIFDFRDGSQRGIPASAILIARWQPSAHTWIAVSEPGGKPVPNR